MISWCGRKCKETGNQSRWRFARVRYGRKFFWKPRIASGCSANDDAEDSTVQYSTLKYNTVQYSII
jgi:hypothetical protein